MSPHADYGGAASLGAEPRLETIRSLARVQLANTLICTNDATKLDGLKVESVTGNVSQDIDRLRIIGGSSTSGGNSWMYWNFTPAVGEIYVRVKVMEVSSWGIYVEFANDDGSIGVVNPPDLYYFELATSGSANDVRLYKNIAGTGTLLAYETVDLSIDKYYDFELYYEGDGTGNNRIIAWRDGYLVGDVSDTEPAFPAISSIRLRVVDVSNTSIQEGCYSKPFIILTSG